MLNMFMQTRLAMQSGCVLKAGLGDIKISVMGVKVAMKSRLLVIRPLEAGKNLIPIRDHRSQNSFQLTFPLIDIGMLCRSNHYRLEWPSKPAARERDSE